MPPRSLSITTTAAAGAARRRAAAAGRAAPAANAAAGASPKPAGKRKFRADPALRYAFVHALWHADIVEQGRDGFIQEMARHGVPASSIDIYTVPGAFEIPLLAKRLAKGGRHAGIVGCALVVDGGIYRHDFVANAVVGALMSVQLETEVPVFSVVLTPHHFHEHEEHQRYFREHFLLKGAEAARACVHTVAVHQQVAAPA